MPVVQIKKFSVHSPSFHISIVVYDSMKVKLISESRSGKVRKHMNKRVLVLLML